MGISPLRFAWPLPEELLCPGCGSALDDALYVNTCKDKHPVCPACLQKRLDSTQSLSCPVCFKEGSMVHVAVETKKSVGEHLIRCSDARCSWIGPLQNEQEHGSLQCEYREVPCALCHQTVPHDDTYLHSQHCPKVTVQCGHGGRDCGGTDRGLFARDESELHTLFCSNLPCSTPGCTTRSTLANIRTHQNQCREIRRYNLYLEHSSKIHHTNASLLATFIHGLVETAALSQIQGGTEWAKLAKTLYPTPLKQNEDILGTLPTGIVVKSLQPTPPITPAPTPSDPPLPAFSSSSPPATLESIGQDTKPRFIRGEKTSKMTAKKETPTKGDKKEEVTPPASKKRKLRSNSNSPSVNP